MVLFNTYSLHLKKIVLPPGYFCSEMVVRFSYMARIWGSKSNIFAPNFIIKKSFNTATSGGVLG